ncbi:hypothetical protein RFI_16570 [Reticulomyxa filosa]|uniref:Uncharacterized protein n=1 Tax=Reticulomyxa filosa TaxID=46433 RepID=X6N2Z3_RETFI|nr:hypothetical protein RFI_16570 [Reticulomyxa filosa]|eukprot:ETO20645.1 hypothetical protein RFI_16570 [Reticulomyxa filosa]
MYIYLYTNHLCPQFSSCTLCKFIEKAKYLFGELYGNFDNSTEIYYYPRKDKKHLAKQKNSFVVDTKTAGSVCLLLQIALPCCLFEPHPMSLTLKGGTNASFAPPIDYVQNVLQVKKNYCSSVKRKSNLFFVVVATIWSIIIVCIRRLLNVEMNVTCKRRGFYPHGGGEILMQTQPISWPNQPHSHTDSTQTSPSNGTLPAFQLTEKGNVKEIRGIALVSKIDRHVAVQIAQGAKKYLAAHLQPNIEIDIQIKKEDSLSVASAIILVAETTKGESKDFFFNIHQRIITKTKKHKQFEMCQQRKKNLCIFFKLILIELGVLFGSSALRDKNTNITNAQIGESAAHDLLEDLIYSGENCCVDRYLQDQLIIFAALAQGKSELKCGTLELHTKTAIHFAEIS